MRVLNFSPLLRAASTDPFDRWLDLTGPNWIGRGEEPAFSYPPYDIEQFDADHFRITLAIAGFGANDIDVEAKPGVLTITGKTEAAETVAGATESGERKYLYQGVARRDFVRRFQLAENIKVGDAKLENGLLRIDLTREIPEAAKPRKIKISGEKQTSDKAQAA